jgi:high-affinity Fe2+/Pb2+ permease
MYTCLTNHGTGVAFGLGLLVTVSGLIAIIGGMDSFSRLAEEDQTSTGIFNAALYGTFILLVATVVVAIGFGLFQLVSSPKNAIKFLVSIVGLVVLGFLFYSLSEVETSGTVYQRIQNGELSGGMSKILNGALWTTIALSAIAVLGIVFSEIRNLFK